MELSAAEILEIQNLIADYTLCADGRDIGRFGELWTEDATLRFSHSPAGLPTVLLGRPAIVEAFAGYFEQSTERQRQNGIFSRHFCMNTRLGVMDGDVVVATTAMLVVRHEDTAGLLDTARRSINRTGTYSDRFARESERWRIAERSLQYDPPPL